MYLLKKTEYTVGGKMKTISFDLILFLDTTYFLSFLKEAKSHMKAIQTKPFDFSDKMIRAVFSWSIFISAVIDHMTCYNLNWPKIKL